MINFHGVESEVIAAMVFVTKKTEILSSGRSGFFDSMTKNLGQLVLIGVVSLVVWLVEFVFDVWF